MASQQAATETRAPHSKYSKRLILKTVLEGGTGLVGQTIVIGGWVKSSNEVRKEPLPPPAVAGDTPAAAKDVTCVEILQTRIPFFRSIMKVLGGNHNPGRGKLESIVQQLPPPPSVVVLQVSDGSCVPSLQVLVDSSIAPPIQVMATGTCILVEGILQQPTVNVRGKHAIELRVEKIMHVGTVVQDKYPLSKKRLPLDMLSDFPHFRPRTTTVASITRIRHSLTQATHTFFLNNGFLYVDMPIITTTDSEGFSDKFQVTTLLGKAIKKEAIAMDDTGGVSLETIKASINEKSKQVEELKRTESNREALVAALQDLRKTNELAAQLEAREKSKSGTSVKTERVKVEFSEDFFSRQTFLTASGRLHLESYACALGNVYSFGPRFRAQKLESKKQVAEMWMIELEIAFSQLEDAMNCADDFLKFVSKWVLENCSEDLKFLSKRVDPTIVDRLLSLTSSSFQRISYAEAMEVLKQVKNKNFEAKLELGMPLTEEHESYLVDEIYKRPVIIHNYPKELQPFYVRLNDDGKTVAAFDVVLPKAGKLIRASQNEERFNVLTTRIKELNLPKEQYEWYLDLRRHGTVMHSGFSLSFDLLVVYATGLIDVREVIPFPRSHGKATN
ncbi:asparagine--tRNA ligase, cytoplasmic 2-like [Rhododendron vialii]|uniref:asparagine--tRNA ligase, cytoplasmic 2-like n=1 Tax=Rhododendron vialii TaxID=182163 RepID=UPI00265FB97E|nr:asparagine--tRNA ligase, cytoplasmic 2-like [Rhododendron vialii]